MPFQSKSQLRKFHAMESSGELPKGTASRWAKHTPNMKSLPEKKADDGLEKRAFVASFVLGCARAGVTDPGAVARLAVKFAAAVEAGMTKAALGEGVGGAAGGLLGGLTTTGVIGSIGLPLTLGFAGGTIGGKIRNQTDEDDAEVLRLAAEANAYRRRAAEAKMNHQVRKLLASDPKKYIQIG